MNEHLVRMFHYDDWANREEVARLSAVAASQRAVDILAHIIAAHVLWYARIRRETPRMEVWPKLQLHEMTRHLDAIRDEWDAYLRNPISGSIEYTNSKKQTFTSDVLDVLTHVVIHGAYHRGQIATLLRQTNEEPAYTDYIHCTRIGAI